MQIKLVVDSGCDLSPELTRNTDLSVVPLSLQLGDEIFVDDSSLDIETFIHKIQNAQGPARSACPSPSRYSSVYSSEFTTFVVTLSSRLSASYNSAVIGREMSSFPDLVYVVDSLSASAGELLIALTIKRLAEHIDDASDVAEKISKFVRHMKTFFVLENLDTLSKNGRMGKVTAKIASILGIRPILGSNGEGEIVLCGKARGAEGSLKKMVDLIGEHHPSPGGTLVISHCNRPSSAAKLRDWLQKGNTPFDEIIITSTGGLSTMYANEGGIIVAFGKDIS